MATQSSIHDPPASLYLNSSLQPLYQGVDTGAGMVVFGSPVTVATVVPDSEPSFNQVCS